MPRLNPHSVRFTLLLASLVTLASFATDMGLPVLAETAASLGVTPATAALTMSVFMVGFAFGPFVVAPISDRLGRRPILLMGVATFAVFGALGAFAQSLGALLTWRLLMGAGAGTAQVLVIATVRDNFTGSEARARQSYVNLAAGLAPMIAPTLGVFIASLGGWRAIYGALAAGGAVLWVLAARNLGESAPLERASSLTVRGTIRNYVRVVSHPVTMGYAVVVALLFGCLFAYVSGSSLILIGVMGVSQRVYGLLFACTSLGLVFGAFLNARLNRRGVSHTKLVAVGMIMVASVASLLFALALSGVLSATLLVPLVVLSFVFHAIVRANAVQGALEPMPEIAGVASAVVTGFTMLVGALASAVAAALFDGRTPLAMTGTMATCSLAALCVYFIVVRPAERRFHAEHPYVHTAELEVIADGVAA
jgi:DHA1 family bicyclomycin/chloramphenicol resistance-like MFS transporter